MGAKFAALARLDEHVGYDAASMAATLRYMIGADDWTVLVSEAGCIGGGREPHPFNHAHWIATEVFWWSEGRDGLQLLAAFEAWAREKCHSVRMLALEAVAPERVATIYRKAGYTPLERGFLKVL